MTEMVTVIREVWAQTKQKMLPTPAKFHYVFHLRDLSRVTQGCNQVMSQYVNQPDTFVALWSHECNRVFPDKFVCQEDKDWFYAAVKRIGCEVLGDTYKQVLTDAQSTLFCSFMTRRRVQDPAYLREGFLG